MLQHQIEQRVHIVLRAIRIGGHPALTRGTIENRKVKLLVGGVQSGKEVEHLIHHFRNAGIRTIDLIDGDNRFQADFERLAHHKFGLWHRAFGRVHQHDRAIHHGENALHLTAEIGVAGRVDDVDADVLVDNRGGLGQNGDAAFFFKIVGVHHAFRDALVVTERTGLAQQLIHKGGLAVVNMGDDGDITHFHIGNRFSYERGQRSSLTSRPSFA